jgi:enoyl-CoA hydratase
VTMIDLTYDEEFAVLTIRRPEALNALSFELIGRIGEAIKEAGRSSARALIVTGEGEKAFCAGADIKELQHRGLAAQREGAELGQAVFALLDRLPIPSVALINGFAFGGGCELALACTLRLALPNAKLGLPEVKLGLIPGYGGTQRLPRLVGPGRALEMVMTGRTVGAEEALAMGLVNRIVQPPGLVAAKAYAREFSSHGLRALQFAREAVQRALDVPLHEGLRVEADLSTLAYRTGDAEEGMQAFVEKRKPQFKGE